MRVFFFVSSVYTKESSRGGIADLLYQLIPGLMSISNEEYEIEVVSLFGETEDKTPFPVTILQNEHRHRSDSSVFKKLQFWFFASLALMKFIITYRATLRSAKIVSCSPGASFILPFFFKNVLIWENVSFFTKGQLVARVRLFIFYIFNCNVIVPTKYEESKLAAFWLMPDVTYIQDWFDGKIEPVKRQRVINRIRFMSAGALESRKGFDLLLTSIANLPEDTKPLLHFTIYGSGSQYSNLKDQIRRFGLSDHVVLAGFVSDLVERYRDYDAFILSSRYEGFPLVMVNALASGMPVLAFDCETGPAEVIVSGANGMLIENGSCEAMCRAIVQFVGTFNSDRYFENCVESARPYALKTVLPVWDRLLGS